MRCQTYGYVVTAWDHLDVAARNISAKVTAEDRVSGVRLVRIVTPADRLSQEERHLALIIWREQSELRSLQERATKDEFTARDYLIEAAIEFLTRVEFDPWTWGHPREDPAISEPHVIVNPAFAVPSRKSLLDRATRLRKFVDANQGDLAAAVWDDLGGYRALRAQALRRLADRPGLPRLRRTPPAENAIRVRHGRKFALEHALAWRNNA
jgi:hypothetical protein